MHFNPNFNFNPMIKSLIFTLIFSVLLLSNPLFATNEGKEEGKSEKFNAGELIIDHISDSHEWHIAGDLVVPLPIIVYSSDKGLSIFSSSNLEHGQIYEGLAIKENHIVAVNPNGKENEEEIG